MSYTLPSPCGTASTAGMRTPSLVCSEISRRIPVVQAARSQSHETKTRAKLIVSPRLTGNISTWYYALSKESGQTVILLQNTEVDYGTVTLAVGTTQGPLLAGPGGGGCDLHLGPVSDAVNPAAAEHVVTFVQNDRLARRHGASWFAEYDAQLIRSLLPCQGGSAWIVVANLRRHPMISFEPGELDEVDLARGEALLGEVLTWCNRDRIRGRVDLRHVDRVSERQPEPAPLTDRIEWIAIVTPDDGAVGCDERSTRYALPEPLDPILQKPPIIVVRNEADFVGVGLISHPVQ